MIDTKKICYLFFDYDGTVFLEGRIPKENREAIARVQQMGHQVILNTGRSRGGLNFSLEKNQGINWDGVIFGATDMTFRGERYHEHTLTDEEIYHWVNYAMDRLFWFAIEGEVLTKRFLVEKRTEALTPKEREDLIRDIQAICVDNPITKMTLRAVDEKDEPKESKLRFVRQEGRHVELYPNGRDKGIGFLDFCRYYNIPKEQCVCFGDGFNDLAIFCECPTSVCMKDSPAILQERATYVAKTELGVAEGLYWLFGKDWDLTKE